MKKEDISALITNNLQKAKDTIVQAEALYDIHQYIGVVNRGYYAMFYTALAILLTKGLGHPDIPGLFPFWTGSL